MAEADTGMSDEPGIGGSKLVRAGMACVFLAIAVLVALGTVEAGDAAAVAGLIVLAGLIMVLPARGVKKVKVGSIVELEWFERAREVALRAPGEEQERGDRTSTADAFGLRMKLEAKLAYIAKCLLGDGAQPSFVTVGSLHYDGYLTDDEAAVADGVMTLRDEELSELSPSDRQTLLKAAEKVVKNIRASVLYGWCEETIEDQPGWTVEEVGRGPKRRPDLMAISDDRKFLVVPAFGISAGSSILANALDRLQKEEDPDVNGRVIILPRRSARSNLDPKGDPAVIRMQDLAGWLAQQQKEDEAPD